MPDKGSSDDWLNMLLGKDRHEEEAASLSQGEGGGGEGDVMIVHSHAPECLPSFFRGKWREGGQEAMLKMMLEAGQVGFISFRFVLFRFILFYFVFAWLVSIF